MSEWQPIETAPTDGTRIIYWHKTYATPVIAFYRDGHIWTGGTMVFSPSAIPREWKDVGTHWMPIPAAPDGDKAGNRGQEIVSDG